MKRIAHTFILLGIGFSCVAAATQALPAASGKPAPAGFVASNTPFATEYYLCDSGQPGPTVFIAGGAHGDEPAGAAAAASVLGWPIVRGKLVILPRANVPALKAGKRYTPGAPAEERNLNRNYPVKGSDATSPRGTPASEIWALVLQVRPDWLLDLHEGYDFHRANSNSVGSTIITSSDNTAVSAGGLMLARVNATIPEPDRKFVGLKLGRIGTLARAASDHLGIPAMILETTYKRPLEQRVWQHGLMVSCLLRHLGMLQEDPASLLASAGSTCQAAPSEKPIRIALYRGPGTGGAGPSNLLKRLECPPQFTITNLSPEQIRSGELTNHDVVIFAGGSASEQAGALGQAGRQTVRRFVEQGGGYIGICAGAYLATCGPDQTRLNLLDAVTVSPKWQRGKGDVYAELTAAGRQVMGHPEGSFRVHYYNGPIVKPAGRTELPDYDLFATFRTELAENGTPVGVMINAPAIFAGTFGKGRAVCISPHPEQTDGLDHIVPRLVAWAAPGGRQP